MSFVSAHYTDECHVVYFMNFSLPLVNLLGGHSCFYSEQCNVCPQLFDCLAVV